MNSFTRSGAKALFLLLPIVLLLACGEPEREGSASSISGYNYTIEGIQTFSVNGAWGGGISTGAGGAGSVCCVMLPVKWTPGLSATVKWERTDCHGDNNRCPKRIEDIDKWPMLDLTKEVSIDRYDRPYTMFVVFLPGDEVRIYVAPYGPDHPDHPLRLGPARPLDHPEWRPYQP